VPIGEVILLLSLVTVRLDKSIGRLSHLMSLYPLFVWWGFGLGRALADMPEHGLWALRDATHVIESLYLIVGFSLASRPGFLEKFFRWLPWLMGLACIYAVGYPVAARLQEWSPTILSGAGYEEPVLFKYTNTALMLLWTASALAIVARRHSIWASIGWFLAVVLVAYAAFLFQSRTIYLQLIAVTFFFLIYRREGVEKGVLGAGMILVFLLLIPVLGIDIEGRLGQPVSLDFLVHHFLAIGGIGGAGVQGTAAGVALRVGWWSDIIVRWTSSLATFLFGRGFGFPLVDFVAHGAQYVVGGQVVREPHNSYISIVARLGAIGAVAWVWMQVQLVGAWRYAYRYYKKLGWREGQNRLLIMMVFFILLWVLALGEDGFEKPYNAIPYYFFWGIVLRIGSNLKEFNKRVRVTADANTTDTQ
jgi:hypothetical protein